MQQFHISWGLKYVKKLAADTTCLKKKVHVEMRHFDL